MRWTSLAARTRALFAARTRALFAARTRALFAAATVLALASTPAAVLPGRATAQRPSATTEAEAARAPASPGVVNLNSATADELQRLPGVGAVRAQAILAARQQRPFRRAQDLMRVRGIGRATFRRLEPMLAVEGPTTLGSRPARR